MFGVSRRDYCEQSKLPFALPSHLLSHDRKLDLKLILEFFARRFNVLANVRLNE